MPEQGAKQGHVAPPAGTGQVPGLGEAFRINLNTGQGVYAYKLPLPEGVARLTPQLSLEYAQAHGLGPFGFGWQLAVRKISRRLDYGIADEPVERFHDAGTELRTRDGQQFAPVRETTFTRYTRLEAGWKIEERNGMVHELGLTPEARLAHPQQPNRIFEWWLERSVDPSGNEIRYTYWIEEGTVYLKEVRYAVYALRFLYEDRPDVRLNGRTGYLRRLTKRCRRIELWLDPDAEEQRIRSWSFRYERDEISGVSLLTSIELVSHGGIPDGSQDVRRPPVVFTYSRFLPSRWGVRWMKPQGSSPPPLDDPDTALVTLDNAPLPGILQVVNGRQWYWQNAGDGTWSWPVPVTHAPRLFSFARAGVAFIDVDSSGTADLLVAGDERLPGYYENGGRQGWHRFVAYPRHRRAQPVWMAQGIRLTDADGNGRIDAVIEAGRAYAVWRNQGEEGWAQPTLSPKGRGEEAPDVSLADPSVHLADMTGDGLQDLVRVRSGRVEYWPALGLGRYGARVVMRQAPRLPDLHRWRAQVFLIDLDGDGCADLVYLTPSGLMIVPNRNGESFGKPVVHEGVPVPLPGTIRPVDLFGEGRVGLLYNARTAHGISYVYIRVGDEEPAYLLSRIDNGSGLVSEIMYRPASRDYARDRADGHPWETNFPFPLMVVAGTRELDLVTGQTVETEYRYHDAHFEPRSRQFQGFRLAERLEKGDESRADTRTVFQFLMAQERLPGNGPEYAHLNGLLQRTEVYGLDGSPQEQLPYTVEEAEYGLQVLEHLQDGTPRVFVFVARRRIIDSERTSDQRIEDYAYDYDEVGNVVREQRRGYGVRDGHAQSERQLVTETTYVRSRTRWLVEKPARIVVRDGEGRLVSETRRYYDGPDFVGLSLGEADRGLLSREEQWVLPWEEFVERYSELHWSSMGYVRGTDVDGRDAAFVQTERHAHDARGLRLADRDAAGYERRYEYDASGLLRLRLIESLGTTHFDYDRTVRQPVRIRYADGSETYMTYDAQGRLRSIAMPGEDPAHPARIIHYDDMAIPNARVTRLLTNPLTGERAQAVMYFDGRGNEVQERIEAGNGRIVVSNTALKNPWGDEKIECEPYDADTLAFSLPALDTLPCRRFFFDARGRVIQTIDFNGGQSTAEYRPFEVIIADANDRDASPENRARGLFGTPRREEFDVFRYRTRIREASGSAQELLTQFRTGPLGELEAILDSHGLLVTYTYDRLGNRLDIRHREAGTRRMWFDGRRKVVRMVDGRNRDIRAMLDARGRLVQLTENGTVVEQYRYDDPAHGALGKLAEVTYPGGRQVFQYDSAGRLVRHAYHFDGHAEPHVVTFEYDPLGRETARHHSNGVSIRKTLTPNGWVKGIHGILDEVSYNARGLPILLRYANGVTTECTYTHGPGRVKTRVTRGPQGTKFEDVENSYDALGLLVESVDAVGTHVRRRYSYDPLYQILNTEIDDGTHSRSLAYHYAGGYNLAKFDESDLELHYDDPGHPDRVAAVTTGGGTRETVTYDANGNITELPGQRFQYNYRDQIIHFENDQGITAEYRYDHKGLRIWKRIDDGRGSISTTYFADREVEIRDGHTTCFVLLGHMRVAIIDPHFTRFVHCDEFGSTRFYSDGAGTKITSIAYHPFGNIATLKGVSESRTFGIHPVDSESGLVYMQRRYYAPRLGRFLSPDPLAIYQPHQYLPTPKGLHPYIYVGNDPLNKADLDGYSFWSVVGAIVGVLAAVAVAALVVLTGGALGIVLGIALAIGLVAVSYVVADAAAGSDFGEFMRGFLIGLNAGFNAMIATVLFGPVVGVTLGVINFLAAFDTVANSEIYQAILGWSSWLMPMSWLATAIGLIFFVLNVIPALFTFNQVNAVRINRISIDWGTGTIVMEGGWTFLPGFRGGFNLGNFAYVTPGSTVRDHETGHTLSNAAFGSLFHFIGAIDENLIRSDPTDAYAERIAESHDPSTTDPDIIPMWV